MNFKNWFSRSARSAVAHSPSEPNSGFPAESLELSRTEQAVATGNVFNLPASRGTGEPAHGRATEGSAEMPLPSRSSGLARPAGLMDEPELQAYLAENFFGFGRHNGSHYRSHEALEREVSSLVARFQNVLRGLAARRQARLDRIERYVLELEGLGPTLAAELHLASVHLKRDIAALNEQVELGGEHKGWVLEVLNRYRLGFDRGVREALEFELLGT